MYWHYGYPELLNNFSWQIPQPTYVPAGWTPFPVQASFEPGMRKPNYSIPDGVEKGFPTENKPQNSKIEDSMLQRASQSEEEDKTICQSAKKNQKKNTETNLINQIFRFLSDQMKSAHLVRGLLRGDQKKVRTFYAYMKTLKRSKGKYLNRQYRYQFTFLPKGKLMTKSITRSSKRTKILPIEEFRIAVFKLVIYFLKGKSVSGIISSSRMVQETVRLHLSKRRQLIEFLEEKLVERKNP